MIAALPAIILAAGGSRRLGEPKQLLTLGGETLVERTVRIAMEAGASPVLVVIGARSDLIRAALGALPVIPVLNDRWDEGIASSIHAGLRALDADQPNSPGTLIVACDQPHLTAAHLRSLIDTFLAQTHSSIIASAYSGTLGVPAAFPRCVFPNLSALQGDKGARSLLLDPPNPLVAIDFDGGEIDIDRPEDLAHLT